MNKKVIEYQNLIFKVISKFIKNLQDEGILNESIPHEEKDVLLIDIFTLVRGDLSEKIKLLEETICDSCESFEKGECSLGFEYPYNCPYEKR